MHLTEHKPNHSQIPLLCMLDRQKHVTRCHGRGRRHMPADDAVTLLSTGLLRMFFCSKRPHECIHALWTAPERSTCVTNKLYYGCSHVGSQHGICATPAAQRPQRSQQHLHLHHLTQ